jgi:hypothetical protein
MRESREVGAWKDVVYEAQMLNLSQSLKDATVYDVYLAFAEPDCAVNWVCNALVVI